MRHRATSLLSVALAAGLICATTGVARADLPVLEVNRVHLLEIEGAIGPIAAEYLLSELSAEGPAAEADLIVLRLDTPGGLDTAMREMVQAILDAGRPVAVYVAPDGARAASAGVFLLAAAHVAAMAPATNTGAAHPVNMGGQMDETMAEKVTNDAVAYLESLAVARGRPLEWCEAVVRESASFSAPEALSTGLIDLVATDVGDLLAQLEGRRVVIRGDSLQVRTDGAVVVERPMNWRRNVMRTLTDPNIAYIFLMLGVYGLFFELSRPGAVLPGVVGAISLLLAVLAFQQLPVNYVGVLLVLLGVLMLVLEIKVTSFGALAIGGTVALFLGSVLLFDDMPGLPGLSLKLILPVVAFTAGGLLLILGIGLRAQRRPVACGNESLIGRSGRVRDLETVEPDGRHLGRLEIDGEYWTFRCPEPVGIGDEVEITAADGLGLVVSLRNRSVSIRFPDEE